MKVLAHLLFFPILLITLAVSGYATYEVLTDTVGIYSVIALGAAIVIDSAAIWLGLHATILAKLGDSTKSVQLATWFVIAISVAVNFYHGFVEGSFAGGLTGIIFPVLAAILFHFYIKHTIREALRVRGRILPEKPIYLNSKKYGDKARQEAIERDYVRLTYETAETNLSRQRDKLNPRETAPVPTETHNETTETELVPQRDTDETASLADQIDRDFAAQALRDINRTMTIKEIVEVLVSQGIEDYGTIETKVNEVRDKPVSRETIRKTVSRVKRDSETGE
jgi:hypothetical protein